MEYSTAYLGVQIDLINTNALNDLKKKHIIVYTYKNGKTN